MAIPKIYLPDPITGGTIMIQRLTLRRKIAKYDRLQTEYPIIPIPPGMVWLRINFWARGKQYNRYMHIPKEMAKPVYVKMALRFRERIKIQEGF